VRDQYGKKMSKTRGNTVDPLKWIEDYGADAVRFTLAAVESGRGPGDRHRVGGRRWQVLLESCSTPPGSP